MKFIGWNTEKVRRAASFCGICIGYLIYGIAFICILGILVFLICGIYEAATGEKISPCDSAYYLVQHNLRLIPDDIDYCKKGMCYKGAEWKDMLEALEHTKQQIDNVPDCAKAQAYRSQVIELIDYLSQPTPGR